MKKSENFVYLFNGVPYINLTNRCSNDCVFCLRNAGEGVGSGSLWLSREPGADEVIAALKNLAGSFGEIVFCGYGEPTYRTGEIVEIAAWAKRKKIKTRLNTNGLGDLINGRDIVPELALVIDTVSVSLNASDAADYQRICRSVFGEDSFAAVLSFAEKCVECGVETVLSVVETLPAAERDKCQELAEQLGARLRVRKYIE